MTSALKNSQIDHEFDDSTRIWMRGYAHSKQKIKANLLVVSLLLNGHQNIAGDESERRSSTVTNAGTLQPRLRRWSTWEEPEAHHEAIELVGEAGGGQEEEIDGDQSSGCRARRCRLEAS
jgi:hypothetical protein